MSERLKGFLGNLRRGFVRFTPFNVGAVLLAAFLIWHNHIPWKEREIAGLLPISLACGVCWGMLAALAARLALERRSARPRLLSVLPNELLFRKCHWQSPDPPLMLAAVE
jgi:hypothetical protein